MVETALASGAMLLTIFASLELGRAMWTWQAVASAAYDGARKGIVLGTDAGVTMPAAETIIEKYVQDSFTGLNPAEVIVTAAVSAELSARS